mmetsp:Transcript_71963/g.223385  ORF Transcript_71963/g.223385 Transcript_71963/m.223385 type:complete len:328 (+) Transcript_71963:458-1441(+)
MNRTLSSIGNTRIIMHASLAVGVANVLLSFLLIPRLGFVGAPITATACDVVQAFMVCLLALWDADFRKCWGGFTREAWRSWPPFLRLSCPALALLGIEWWTWDLQSLLAGFISPLALATQAVVPQLTDLQYCVGQALGTAASTVIGNLLGKGRMAAARRAAFLVMLLCLGTMSLQALVFLALRERFPQAFTRDPAILRAIAEIMPLTLAFSFLDSHQAALSGILVGAGRQSLAVPLIFGCYWVVGVPLGSALAFGALGSQPWGLRGLWLGMLLAVLLHTLSFGLAVLRLDWARATAEARERTRRECSAEGLGTSLVEAGGGVGGGQG